MRCEDVYDFKGQNTFTIVLKMSPSLRSSRQYVETWFSFVCSFDGSITDWLRTHPAQTSSSVSFFATVHIWSDTMIICQEKSDHWGRTVVKQNESDGTKCEERRKPDRYRPKVKNWRPIKQINRLVGQEKNCEAKSRGWANSDITKT